MSARFDEAARCDVLGTCNNLKRSYHQMLSDHKIGHGVRRARKATTHALPSTKAKKLGKSTGLNEYVSQRFCLLPREMPFKKKA